jgi:hypothetical protein
MWLSGYQCLCQYYQIFIFITRYTLSDCSCINCLTKRRMVIYYMSFTDFIDIIFDSYVFYCLFLSSRIINIRFRKSLRYHFLSSLSNIIPQLHTNIFTIYKGVSYSVVSVNHVEFCCRNEKMNLGHVSELRGTTLSLVNCLTSSQNAIFHGFMLKYFYSVLTKRALDMKPRRL